MAAKKTARKKVAKTKAAPKRKRTRRRAVGQSMRQKPTAQAKIDADRVAAEKGLFILKLKDRLGILMYAAEDIGRSRRTIERWRAADPQFNEAVHEVLAKQRAVVEQKLLEKVLEGDLNAIKFYLRCKGRERDVPEEWREMVGTQISGDADSPVHTHQQISIKDQRDRMGDAALAGALKAAMEAVPELFEELDGS